MLLALDVHYRTDTTKAVCIAFDDWADEVPFKVHVIHISEVAEYEPGAFYKRELPCLMVGMPLDTATAYIQSMAGPFRIPTLLKLLDVETKVI